MQEKEKIQFIPVKVYRTEERLMIAAPMPGMEPEDIVVEVTADGELALRGEVRALLKEIKELLIDEWSVGMYYRELHLPNAVDAPHANITYGNGVIVIAFPLSLNGQTIPATLTMEKIGIARGERMGNAGRV